MVMDSTPVTDLLGEQTRAEMFALVLTDGPISRTGIAHRLGVSPSTVTRLLLPLVEGGYLQESQATRTGPGRPQLLLRVNARKHAVVGIKIGPGRVVGVLTDMAARVIARGSLPLSSTSAGTVLDTAARLAGQLIKDAPSGDDGDPVLGIGVGVSGHVDARTGVCRVSPLLGWADVDVARPLSARTGLPVVVNNDVNTLVVAERWFGHGREVDSFAVVTVGPGIGCGLLLDSRLYAGASGMAGEFGHLPQDPDGPVCGCGRVGCLEVLSSTAAVLRHLRDSGAAHPATIEQAMALARTATGAASDIAREAFSRAGAALGRGLAGLCNILNLQRVVIAGEGVVAQDLFGPAMTKAFEEHAFSDSARDCHLLFDPVTDDLWARGAACLVIRDIVRAPLS
ncbi:ROK family transcriptional regulator [Allostreptomyces psammosilenae]|uniref:Putative NBD/HSP70 family sugar kinase n=1 Tax=Allostreptomyces psammosilenae TaxID=1892865 RepID=A0A852ZYP3_9ACTN|nr:ROK family transcriptional regulator [Allostreptomyces psammosilenae]NYI03731.1 putative NBD/HSP70 family sugar kinase [Allostreptomyces psammosilenae]